MNFLPLYVDLKNKHCLVIGGGEVAARKIELLLCVKAQVEVIAPALCDSVAGFVANKEIRWQERDFKDADIGTQSFIIAATNNKAVNAQVSKLAHKQNIPVNVVDAPELCSVIFPAIVDRSPLIIAISSSGTSPVLARFVRGKIESVIHERFGDLATLLEKHRDVIRKRFTKLNERRAFIEALLNGQVAELTLSGQTALAEQQLLAALSNTTAIGDISNSCVISCPKDTDLLTFKSLRVMQQADMVFYTNDINPQIVDLTRRDAQRILLSGTQNSQELIAKAANKRVVWLQAQTHLQQDQVTSDADFPALMAKLTPKGEVYLVGGGPGDPELLTFKALRLMQQCDVVLYDRLVGEKILALVNAKAERIFVGKERTNHPVPQEQINALLIRLAKEGKRVLRLKGGDPFIFGRGGEEIMELCANNIPFQVVPGITAANACSTYSGIPLTHRDYAQSVRFVAGHMRKDGQEDLNWQQLISENETLVFYMGLHQLPKICEKLITHGMNENMPIALVQAGSLPEQQVITGTLNDIQIKLAQQPLQAPTLIIVGEVVKLHNKLAWFNEEIKNDG